jgi:prepilin-type N-terminal cleavage/methylation domain-containing protein
VRTIGDRGRGEHGFTLIEVLVSALLVLIISAGVATALISATDFTSRERNQSQANAVAEQDQERLKSMTDSQLTSLHQTRTVTLNNTKFTVTSTASFLSANGTSSCSSDSTAYFKLTSTVTSIPTPGNPAQTVTEETIITRPLAGSLVVPVKDQTGAPLQGVAVNIVGQNTNYTQSATTDQNGCVAFAGLPTDSYTITATDTGYVDPNGNASPSETASVTQTSITPASTMIMGQAGQIKVGFATQAASAVFDQWTTPPFVSGAEISYYGTGNGNHMTTDACFTGSACTGTGSNPVTYAATGNLEFLSPGSLFPFYLGSSAQYTNNYQVWAGACEQEEPLSPPTVGGAETDFATVSPGKVATLLSTTTVDATVFEPAIDVAIKSNGGAALLPSHVDVQFTGMNSAGTASTCQDTWKQVPRVGTETGSNGIVYGIYPAPFASQSAVGSATASATGDKGTIKVCADNGTNYVWSPAFANTNFTAATTVTGSSGNLWLDVKKDTGWGTGTCP